MDRQTTCNLVTVLCTASHGKNEKKERKAKQMIGKQRKVGPKWKTGVWEEKVRRWKLRTRLVLVQALESNVKDQGPNIYNSCLLGWVTRTAAVYNSNWHTDIRQCAVQSAAAQCPNEWTLGPQFAARQTHLYVPASHTMAFTPQCCPLTTHYF